MTRVFGVQPLFASVTGGTWPNRLFLVAGSSGGRVIEHEPPLLYELPSVFDRLRSDEWDLDHHREAVAKWEAEGRRVRRDDGVGTVRG